MGRRSADEESSLPPLDGHASVALKISAKGIAEKRAKSKQAIIDQLINASDTQKELFLSYYAGQIKEDIANKSIEEIAELFITASFPSKHAKDWIVLKEEPDYTHLRNAVKLEHFIAKQRSQPEFQLWHDSDLENIF